jgi:hypothetical protein
MMYGRLQVLFQRKTHINTGFIPGSHSMVFIDDINLKAASVISEKLSLTDDCNQMSHRSTADIQTPGRPNWSPYSNQHTSFFLSPDMKQAHRINLFGYSGFGNRYISTFTMRRKPVLH